MGLTEASAFKDGSIVNNDVKSDAAIAGTKVSPNFGSQNVVTTGTLGSDNITVTGVQPKIYLNDIGQNPDYSVRNQDGTFRINDDTNNAARLEIVSNGTVDIGGNLDVGAGIDITGNLTVTGTTTLPNQGNGLVPVGTVITYAGASAPTGYLKSNGDTIPDGSGTVQGVTADFSALYAIVGATLPDLRGEFVRGFDDGKGTDSGRAIRSSQTDQNKNHTHTFSGSGSHSHSHGLTVGNDQDDNANAFDDYINTSSSTQTANTNAATVTISISGNTGSATNSGTEVRPRNVALLMCIKY